MPKLPLAVRVLVVLACTAPAAAQDEKPKDAPVQPDGLKNLRHPDPNVRYRAAAVLAEQGPRARFAIADLREALKDTDPLVRVKVAEALWQVERPSPSAVVPVLVRALREKNPDVRVAACGVVGLMGSKGKAAVGALVETLKDKELSVVIAAIAALGDVGPAASESADALLALAGYADFPVLEPIVGAALGGMGTPVVPALTAAVKDPSLERRRVAAYALGSIGADARGAVPALERLLRDEQATMRFLAARALGAIGKDAVHALPRLHEAASDKDASSVRVRAALAVWQIAGDTKHVPRIADALRDAAPGTREAAAEALASIGAAAKETTPALTKASQDPEPAVRQAAIVALGCVGPAARTAEPALRSALKDADKTLRQHAALALWRVTGDANDSLAVLRLLLADEPRVQLGAAETLGLMGAAAHEALPTLVMLYRDEDNATARRTIGAAIRRIDPAVAGKLGIR